MDAFGILHSLYRAWDWVITIIEKGLIL